MGHRSKLKVGDGQPAARDMVTSLQMCVEYLSVPEQVSGFRLQ
jgi:hypothetical protein